MSSINILTTDTKEKEKEDKCPICLDTYTQILRQKISCPFCPIKSCRVCTQQYLLSSLEEPNCFSCKRAWNREFIDLTFTMTFRKGPLKLHRRKVLEDREKSILPSMQVYVEATKNRDNAIKQTNKFTLEMADLNKIRMEDDTIFRTLIRKRDFNDTVGIDWAKQVLPTRMKITELQTIMSVYQYINLQNQNFLDGREGSEKVAPKQFIMKCPGPSEHTGEGCRGFLSSQWKCGTCQKHFCHDCHVLLGDKKDDTHVCDADAKATAKMIQKETKPCPKCGIRISKIDGCDQMWCTSCQTSFSWISGQIVTGRVHNPHFYDWQRRKGGTVAQVREVGDIPCGGIPDYYRITRIIQKIKIPPESTLTLNDFTLIYNIHRSITDITEVRLPVYPLLRGANANRDLNVAYLMERITQEAWAKALEQGETKFERRREIGMILQTIAHVGAEKLRDIQNYLVRYESILYGTISILNDSFVKCLNDIKTVVNELEQLRIFSNEALKLRGKQMGIVVPQIKDDWHWSMTRKTKVARDIDSVHDEDAETKTETKTTVQAV